jgi:hypothetical protein
MAKSDEKQGDLAPDKPIRRFDVFAEYTRLERLDKDYPQDEAKGYGIWLATETTHPRRLRQGGPKNPLVAFFKFREQGCAVLAMTRLIRALRARALFLPRRYSIPEHYPSADSGGR